MRESGISDASAGRLVSIIIPSYNSGSSLGWVLEGISHQAEQNFDTEVIVIESGGGDYVASLLERFPSVRFMLPGRRLYSGQARNAGAMLSRGGTLAFLDSDCRPEPGWLSAITRALDSGAGAVCGALRNGTPESVAGTSQHLMSHSACAPELPARRITDSAASSGNFAIRRDLFFEAKGFAGTYRAVDFHLTANVVACGAEVRFCPEAVVSHINDTSPPAVVHEQVRRGYWAAVTRIAFGARGSGARYFPPLALGLFGVRMYRLLNREILYRPVPAAAFLKALPICAAGIAAWTWGYMKGSFGSRADLEEKEPFPRDWESYTVLTA